MEGSPGCGQFTGTYRGTDGQLAISASWADDTKSPCSGEQKDEATKIIHALASVRRIRPAYDALLLQDENEVLQVRLAAMQPGKDLSEVHDTFWLLKQVEGSTQDLAHVVIDIDQTGINFSTPSFFLGMPFEYHLLTGLKFSAPPSKGGNSNSSSYYQDRQVANLFEAALYKVNSYELNKGDLTFFDTAQHPIIVLSALQPTGIEDRKWRIAKYRMDNSGKVDKDGLIDATETAWIVFVNGTVIGTLGAPGWGGTYKLSGDELSVNAGFVHGGAGIDKQLYQSDILSQALSTPLRIIRRGDNVLLCDKNGNAQILLVPSR